MTATYRTNAAFLTKQGTWEWHAWNHNTANKHAAIVAKARDLGSVGQDFGNADHEDLKSWNHQTRG